MVKKFTNGVRLSKVTCQYEFHTSSCFFHSLISESLDVNIYLPTPEGKKAMDFIVDIQTSRLKIGLKGHDRLFMDDKTYSTVDKSESSWYLDAQDSLLHIILVKAHRGKQKTGQCPTIA
jgi:hypothetical protein